MTNEFGDTVVSPETLRPGDHIYERGVTGKVVKNLTVLETGPCSDFHCIHVATVGKDRSIETGCYSTLVPVISQVNRKRR